MQSCMYILKQGLSTKYILQETKGVVYEEDRTNFGVCDNFVYDSNECLKIRLDHYKTTNYESQQCGLYRQICLHFWIINLYRGLLDRCTVSQFTDTHYTGFRPFINAHKINAITYFTNISNINISQSVRSHQFRSTIFEATPTLD